MNEDTVIIFIILTASVAVAEHPRTCLSCSDMSEGESCQHLVTCSDNEICFLQKYITTQGDTRYDTGCINPIICPQRQYAVLSQRRTSDHSHILCHKCCNDTHICNIDLTCNVQNLTCLSCSNVDDPLSCKSTVSCGLNEMCYTHFYETESGQWLFDLGCKPDFLCGEGNQYPLGRRSSEGKRLHCGTCCAKSNNCNANSSCRQQLPVFECEDINSEVSGVYAIKPRNGQRVRAYCIMEKDKKWTVIQRRFNGSVDFYRTWNEYKVGFGFPSSEYWLGNDNIHLISTAGKHELSVVLGLSNGTKVYANYTIFAVGDENTQYFLNCTGYTGNAGDAMGYGGSPGGNAHKFSTKDRDNDDNINYDCCKTFHGAWWYGHCRYAGINEKYSNDMYWQGSSNVVSSIMMIRRIHL